MHSNRPSWFVLSSEATANIQCDALIPSIVFTVLALCVVALRWYSRVCLRPGYVKMEDYLVTAAMLLSVGITAVVGAEFGLEMGHTDKVQRLSTLSTMLKLVFAQSIFYHLAVNLVKASFVLQYMHLFSIFRLVVHVCYVLLVIILGAAAWGVFGAIFLCKPVQGYWTFTKNTVCMDAETHFWSTSVIGVVLDWVIWMLPTPVVGRLRLPRRQKMGLVLVFGLGVFVCIVSILRLVLVHEFANQGKVTKSGTYALIWSSLEVNLAIICASLLVMKPLFARFIPAIVSEQPISASEDGRQWRQMAGIMWLQGATMDEDKEEEHEDEDEDGERRDTAIGMDGGALEGVRRMERVWDHRRSARSGSPATI